jgi:hypothetical protein
VLLDKLSTREERDWYAAAASEYGWSRGRAGPPGRDPVGRAGRVGAVELRRRAAAPDSELAQQLVRDPYVFDHLALSERAVERELEQALMDRLQQTLLAFGQGVRRPAGAVRRRRRRRRAGAGPAAVLGRAAALRRRGAQDRPVRPGLHRSARDLRCGRRRPAAPQRPARSHRGDLAVQGPQRHPRPLRAGQAPAPLAVADYTLPPQERGGLPTAAELAAALEPSVPPAGAAPKQQKHPN